MKRLISFLLLVFAAFNTFAQYYGNTLKIVYGHRSIPVFVTDEEERTYFTECSFTSEVSKFVNSAKVSSLLRLEPWQEKTSEDEAFVKIHVGVSDMLIDKRAVEAIDRFGHVMFRPVVECTMTTVLRIESELDNYRPSRTKVSIVNEIDKFYPEPFLAEEYIENNKEVYIRQAVSDQIVKMTDDINGYFYHSYLYGTQEDFIRVFFFDTPKNKNYEKHKAGKNEISQIFSDLSSNYDLNLARQRMRPWLEHFENLYNSLDINDKKQKNAKMQILRNLAVINYALDDFVSAYRYAEDLKENFPNSDADKIIEQIVKTKNLLKEHGLTSRYF